MTPNPRAVAPSAASPSLGKTSRLLVLISLVLIAGFLATGLASFWVSRDTIREGVTEQALTLTGDNIYSEIQKDILRPVFISSLMASDTFVRDWLLSGEQEPERIARYLREIKSRYSTVSSFLVSDLSRRYYYGDGVLKAIDANAARDAWYFRVREMKAAYEINVDYDFANNDAMTVFINYRVEDFNGRFIGVTGVGLTLESITRLIKDYQNRFQRRIYFVDEHGEIMLSSQGSRRGLLREVPGHEQLALQVAALPQTPAQPIQAQVQSEGRTLLVHARYLPEVKWSLVVEQDMSVAEQPLWQVFWVNLGISLGITLVVLVITLLAARHAQSRLQQLATTDAVTGLLNRHALGIVLEQWQKEIQRSPEALSAILIDIDHFKRINDELGHLRGDDVLRQLGAQLRTQVRTSDVVARWGGEEFLILLRNCPEAEARTLAEAIREQLATLAFGLPDQRAVTISAGVASLQRDETDTAFFARLDAALYAAKAAGRNQVK